MKSRPSVFHNILANFSGKAWHGIFSLAFVPIYISIMGVEVYGLLGIFVSLTAIFGLLDMGIGATLGRELARLSIVKGSEQESRNFVRTVATIYWIIGSLSGLIIILTTPLISEYWIQSDTIDSETVEYSLMIMGVMLAFQWPASIYTGGLTAIQHQVADNVINSVFIMIKHFGAVGILLFVSPSVLGFFIWNTCIALINTLVLSRWLWKLLPKSDTQSKFDISLLVKNWKYASGMLGITVLTLFLTQLDKIILSKMLTLEIFGYYMLAFSLANTIHNLKSPIITALFPRYTQLATSSQENSLTALYHKGCQYLSAIIIPLAVTIAIFSKVVLLFWLGDKAVVENTYLILILLIIGTTINSIMTPPFMMQLAYGWTKLAIYKNIIAVICIVPLMIWLVYLFQGVGAALAWIILNLGYLIFEIPIMHRKVLKSEMWKWYSIDIIFPIIIAFTIGYVSYLAMPEYLPPYLGFSWAFISYLVGMISIVLLLPLTRNDFLEYRELIFEKIRNK